MSTTIQVGTATYGQPRRRRCQRCSRPAELYDITGSWCSPACRDADQAEATR